MTEEPLRLLIADDHPVFSGGLAALLRSVDGLELVGEASDGEEAVALARELQPDVATKVIEYFTIPRPSHAMQAFPELTEREQKTIRNRVPIIFAKLRVADRAEAIVRAREAGMGQKESQPGGEESRHSR